MKAVFCCFFYFLRIYNIVLKFRRDSFFADRKMPIINAKRYSKQFYSYKTKAKKTIY